MCVRAYVCVCDVCVKKCDVFICKIERDRVRDVCVCVCVCVGGCVRCICVRVICVY